jgi:2-alkyl-3-oxoalkanoate reductase
MRLLVTGATGFLGVHTCRELLARGHQVRALGRDFSGFPISGLEIVQGDLRDPVTVGRSCAGVDGVVHAGALSSPWGKLEEFMAVNVGGTRSLLEACAATGVRRLVHVSSPAVIFTGKDHVLERDNAAYPKRFSSHYALSKKLAEELVLEARGRFEVIVLRPKAIYGPGDRALLPRVVSAARSRRLPQIGDGENLVDLTFVDDAVRAIVLALECPVPRSDFPVYTITSGEHVNLWRLLRRLLGALGIRSDLRVIPVSTMLILAAWLERMAGITGREPALTRYGVELLARTQTYDISRAKSDLGFEPRFGLELGLERTLASMRESPMLESPMLGRT